MISKIYYINLDRRPDRNAHVKNEISKLNYNGPVERIVAVDGNTLNIRELPDSLITVEGKKDALDNKKGLYLVLTPGSVGCALSHLKTYNKIIEDLKDDEYALILEDDIYIKEPEHFLDKLNKTTSIMPPFDILFLGYSNTETYVNYDAYRKPMKLWGLFGYLINKKAAIQLKKVFPLRYQIDTEMPKIFKNLKVFYLNDRMILSDLSEKKDSKFPTDTQTRIYKTQNSFLFLLGCIVCIICIVYFVYHNKISSKGRNYLKKLL